MSVEKQPDRQPDPVNGGQRPEREDRQPGRSADFFGLDVENMSPMFHFK